MKSRSHHLLMAQRQIFRGEERQIKNFRVVAFQVRTKNKTITKTTRPFLPINRKVNLHDLAPENTTELS